MTIKFGNFANFIVRNFVVSWGAPILDPSVTVWGVPGPDGQDNAFQI